MHRGWLALLLLLGASPGWGAGWLAGVVRIRDDASSVLVVDGLKGHPRRSFSAAWTTPPVAGQPIWAVVETTPDGEQRLSQVWRLQERLPTPVAPTLRPGRLPDFVLVGPRGRILRTEAFAGAPLLIVTVAENSGEASLDRVRQRLAELMAQREQAQLPRAQVLVIVSGLPHQEALEALAERWGLLPEHIVLAAAPPPYLERLLQALEVAQVQEAVNLSWLVYAAEGQQIARWEGLFPRSRALAAALARP